MRACVLIKTLENMYYNCRNKTLSLTFYETKGGSQNRRPGTRKEFDSNLPDIYYIASVSTGNKTLFVMKKEAGDDRSQDHVLSQVSNFNFDELASSATMQYTVHDYQEISPFAKNSKNSDETGVYKKYEECLKFDATLYVNLFKLMGETVSLVIESGNKLHLGHYIDGKVIIVDTNDWAISIKVTDFYSLNQYLPEYEVVDFVAYPINLSTNKYIKKLQAACEEGGLQFLEI